MAIIPNEDQFAEEVLGLFTLEAQEWINQSNTALEELEQNPPPDRKVKLYETVIHAMTNLGGAAATIELPMLAQLAFGMLPLLQTVRDHGGNLSTEQQAALQDGLGGLISAVQNLHETKTGAVEDLEPLLQKLADAASLSDSPDQAIQQSASTSSSPCAGEPLASTPRLNILEALHDFQRARVAVRDSNRHTAEAVLKAIGAMDQDTNGKAVHVDKAAVLKVLRQLDAMDEEFLAELRQRWPVVETSLTDLKSSPVEALTSSGRLNALLREIHELHEMARALEAKGLMLFFCGLQTFLTLWLRNVIPISIERVEGVELRLKEVLPLAEQWVEAGREERASIEKLMLCESSFAIQSPTTVSRAFAFDDDKAR